MWESKPEEKQIAQAQSIEEDEPSNDEDEEDDGFGDDFDEFAEGGEVDDFGDFDEAEPETPTAPPQEPDYTTSSIPSTLAGLVSRLSMTQFGQDCGAKRQCKLTVARTAASGPQARSFRFRSPGHHNTLFGPHISGLKCTASRLILTAT